MNSRGNAFLYVLIAVILFGALTWTISKSNDNNPTSEIDDAKTKAAVTSILAYEAQARAAINRMTINGVDIGSIDFMLPSNAAFNTAPNDSKLFHPDGGGLQYKPLPSLAVVYTTTSPSNGYYIGQFNNFTWTPTATNDVVFSAYGISKAVCENLNLKITGSKTVPALTAGNFMRYFVDDVYTGLGNTFFSNFQCAACDGYPSLCVKNSGSIYNYYSLLVAR